MLLSFAFPIEEGQWRARDVLGVNFLQPLGDWPWSSARTFANASSIHLCDVGKPTHGASGEGFICGVELRQAEIPLFDRDAHTPCQG